MVKIGEFTFKPLDVPDHWISFCQFGECLSSNIRYEPDVTRASVTLDANKVYQIGMDQSSKNTGIFIKDYENTEAYMIEVYRQSAQGTDQYIHDLEELIHRICKGHTFSHLLYEQPIETNSYRSARVAFQLEGIIRSMALRYDEFKPAKLDCIVVAQWRSVVIDKSLSKDIDKKEMSLISIQNALPWTTQYGISLYKDNDIYEAIGVMLGWFIVSFDPFGRPYVRGPEFQGTIGGFLLPDVGAEDVCKKLKSLNIKSDWAVECPQLSVYNNLASFVTKFKVACVEFSSPYTILCLAIEAGLKYIPDQIVTAILVPVNYVDTALFTITGKDYHFIL